jgi:hypothetical protein
VRAAISAGLLLAVSALAGCGGNDTPEESPAPVQRQMERAFPTLLGESAPVSSSIRPRLAPAGGELALRGSLAEGAVARGRSGGLWLQSAAGRLRLTAQLGEDPSEGRLLAGSQAVLFAAPDAGPLVRAAPAGFTLLSDLPKKDTPMRFELDLPRGGRLRALPKGGVGVLVRGPGGVPSRSLPAGQGVAATLSAPLAIDADGRKVRASMGVDGKGVVLETKAPAVARLELIPSGELGGGWFAYGVSHALRRSRYALEGKMIEGLCASEEGGALKPGEVEVSRQVAARQGGCPSLVETGSP